MARLYTRQGDDGWTVLFNGARVRKDHARVDAYGVVDELNAQLGVAVEVIRPREADDPSWRALRERLVMVQADLFQLGAELATPADAPQWSRIPHTTAEDAARLESWIDEAVAPLPPLRTFVLPGGEPAAAQLHVCRTVCRRAERCVVALPEDQAAPPAIVVYLNRLSDLLFAWARWATHQAGAIETPWP